MDETNEVLDVSMKRRLPLASFTHAMESKLRKNDHKGGWDHLSERQLLELLTDEWDELYYEVITNNKDAIMDEAVDVANFAMMIFDVAHRSK